MSNPTKIYNDYVRANLPNTMTFNSSTARYNINNHSFFSFNRANWYFKYITKFGYASLSAYAVNNFEPDLVFDFKQNYYRTGGTETTLSSAVTHTRAGNATMVDSDGLLKYAPHNLVTHSEDFSNSEWVKSNNGSVVVDNAVAPDGTTTAATLTIPQFNARTYQRVYSSYKAGDKITFSFWVRSDTVTSIIFGVGGGTNAANNNASANTVAPVTSTWNLVELEFTVLGNDTSLYFIIGWYSSLHSAQIGDVEIWHPHAYRSDLGGMVNNPTTSNSYVPTTSSAVYLPRVGHHVYNGSAWVNEGILHESEARTNMVTYSNDFTHSSWTQNVTITPNDAVSPDGTSNASHLSFPSSGYLFITSNSRTVGQKYTISAWVKSYDGTDEAFQLYGESGPPLSQNLIATSEWQRFSFTYTATTSTGSVGGIARPTTNIPASLHVYGIQIEAGATPSSYIPTSGSTVTRAAETLTVPAANMPWPTPVEVTGTELVTNGDFSSGTTGWVDGTTYSGALDASSGKLLITTDSSSGYGSAIQGVPLVVGKAYRLTGSRRAVSGGNPAIGVSNSAGTVQVVLLSGSASTVTNDFSVTFVASSTLSLCLFNQSPTNGNSSEFDNISVKEINPLSVSIQMDGRMTYADNGFSTEVRPYRWQLNSTNYITFSVSTLTGRTGQPIFSQRQSTSGYDEVKGGDLDYSPNINVPFNIASRHGSTFVNGSHEGTLLSANTTPTALPDLSSTNLNLGYIFMGTIAQFRMWDEDLTDAGITEAST